MSRCTCGDMCDSYDFEPCPVHEPADTCTCEMGEMGTVEVLTPGCLLHDKPRKLTALQVTQYPHRELDQDDIDRFDDESPARLLSKLGIRDLVDDPCKCGHYEPGVNQLCRWCHT